MYNPFVRACNYALDKHSDFRIEGLPQFSEDKRIVFIRSHDRPVRSQHHVRVGRVKPDTALLPWGYFNESSQFPYFASYEEGSCTDKSDVGLRPINRGPTWASITILKMCGLTIERLLPSTTPPATLKNDESTNFYKQRRAGSSRSQPSLATRNAGRNQHLRYTESGSRDLGA